MTNNKEKTVIKTPNGKNKNNEAVYIQIDYKLDKNELTKNCATCKNAYIKNFYLVCDIDGVLLGIVEDCKNYEVKNE